MIRPTSRSANTLTSRSVGGCQASRLPGLHKLQASCRSPPPVNQQNKCAAAFTLQTLSCKFGTCVHLASTTASSLEFLQPTLEEVCRLRSPSTGASSRGICLNWQTQITKICRKTGGGCYCPGPCLSGANCTCATSFSAFVYPLQGDVRVCRSLHVGSAQSFIASFRFALASCVDVGELM